MNLQVKVKCFLPVVLDICLPLTQGNTPINQLISNAVEIADGKKHPTCRLGEPYVGATSDCHCSQFPAYSYSNAKWLSVLSVNGLLSRFGLDRGLVRHYSTQTRILHFTTDSEFEQKKGAWTPFN